MSSNILLRLPPELLKKIIEYTESWCCLWNLKNYLALAITDKRLNTFAVPFLYQHIRIKAEQINLLARSLRNRPENANFIKFLHVNVYDTLSADQLESIESILCYTMQLEFVIYPNLLEFIRISKNSNLSKLQVFELRDISGREEMMNFEELDKFLLLPKLHSLCISSPYGIILPEENINLRTQEMSKSIIKCKLKALHLVGSQVDTTIDYILASASNLEEFCWDDNDRTEKFDILKFLDSVRKTLTYIRITDAWFVHYQPTNFRASNFNKLERLYLNSKVFSPSALRKSLHICLPPSLISIKLYFDNTSIFDAEFSQISHFYVMEDYDWIEEFGKNLAEYLPKLEEFFLWEVNWDDSFDLPAEDDDFNNSFKEWNIPPSVDKIYQSRKVELSVQLRTSYRSFHSQGMGEVNENGQQFYFIPSPKRLNTSS
ncbi:putative Bgh-specific protein [Blumeria hordei DH14]|uniref:Putative Bgh-specific protein n=1 Tax=Blumeria graminis f. sp. hordei (strain DH14) TaxID=546991 RepID=N1JEN2_BLUG1|nr:putative Bgh-specific protein [Blumeria hordei DH14]